MYQDLIFTSIGIPGLFYCTWNTFALKHFTWLKVIIYPPHHHTELPMNLVMHQYVFSGCPILTQVTHMMVTSWNYFYNSTFWNLTVELHIFSFTCHPWPLAILQISEFLYSANIELTGWVPSSSPILNQLISLNNYKSTIFMYLVKVLRTYQNWSRVFVCEDTAVSKELIHKRASCKQNCCLVRCRLVQ